MILKKAILFASAVAALSAAAAVGVVAAAFAFYAALEPLIGRAWAAAAVSGAAALAIALGGLFAAMAASPPRPKRKAAEEKDLTAKLFDLAKEKPIVAASAILAAGAVAFKNPKVTAAIVNALMGAGKSQSKS